MMPGPLFEPLLRCNPAFAPHQDVDAAEVGKAVEQHCQDDFA